MAEIAAPRFKQPAPRSPGYRRARALWAITYQWQKNGQFGRYNGGNSRIFQSFTIPETCELISTALQIRNTGKSAQLRSPDGRWMEMGTVHD